MTTTTTTKIKNLKNNDFTANRNFLKNIIMKNLLDTFLLIATDEFGEKLNLSNVQNNGFSGVISINENSADVDVQIDDYNLYDSDLNDQDVKMLEAFISYVQKEMKDQSFFYRNIINTEKSLMI